MQGAEDRDGLPQPPALLTATLAQARQAQDYLRRQVHPCCVCGEAETEHDRLTAQLHELERSIYQLWLRAGGPP